MALTPGRAFNVLHAIQGVAGQTWTFAKDATVSTLHSADWSGSGLAKESGGHLATIDGSTASSFTQLQTGVPPAVTNLTGTSKLLQPPGGSPYTILTMPSNGRLWVVQVSVDIASAAGFIPATTEVYARVYTSAGSDLGIAQVAVASSNDHDSANAVITFPGKNLNSGVSLLLDVNNGVPVTNCVIRASALAETSIP